MKNTKALVWGAIIIIALVVLFAWPKIFDPNKALVKGWHDADVDCLPSHQNAKLHIHPELTITVDGRSEPIPANIGIARGCMAELHTHDATGKIHTESVNAGKTFTLEQFFAVWGKTIGRSGYTMEANINGEPANDMDIAPLPLRDKQKIEINYTKT